MDTHSLTFIFSIATFASAGILIGVYFILKNIEK